MLPVVLGPVVESLAIALVNLAIKKLLDREDG